jgi:transposase-like protein
MSEERKTREARKHYTPEEKVAVLHRHLVEKVAVSEVCEQHGLSPNLFYRWQKEFFENGAAAFRGNGRDAATRKLEDENARLRSRLADKDEVIAEIMAEHVALKKGLGEA